MPKSKQPPPSNENTAASTAKSASPAMGKGMPAKDASVEASLELPSDRDQSTDMTAAEPDPKIEQAAIDLARGLSDTSKGAETDKAYQKQK